MTSPISHLTPTMLSATSNNPSQVRQTLSNQVVPSQDHISSSTSLKTFFEKIQDFFLSMIQKIINIFTSCFKKAASSKPTTQSSFLASAPAPSVDPVIHAQQIQAFETLLHEFCAWEPVLSDIERAEVINEPDSPHKGKTKGQAWDENYDAWIQAIQYLGTALSGALEDVRGSGFSKSRAQIIVFLGRQSNDYRDFLENHINDPQFELVYKKYDALQDALIALRLN